LHKYARRRWENRYAEAVSERSYSTHLLLSCKACADRSRYSAASEHGGGSLKALRDRPDEPSGQHRHNSCP